jgi:K+-transporting ATPase ATPase C chain
MTATTPTPSGSDNTLRHLWTSVIYTIVTIVAFGVIYPLIVWGIAALVFPHQANGSLITQGDVVIGSELVGQNFSKPGYFQPRLSAAGKGYDPTQTGGTNYGPTSKKLIDGTKAAIAALRKANPDATGPIPADLVTSSASGIDPDISPEAAYYQVPRVARARGMSVGALSAIVAQHVTPRQLGILGEPRVNVLDLNRALDALAAVK